MHGGPTPTATNPGNVATGDVQYLVASLVPDPSAPEAAIAEVFAGILEGTAFYLELNLRIADPNLAHTDPTLPVWLQVRALPVRATIGCNGAKRTFTARTLLLAGGAPVGPLIFTPCSIWLESREGGAPLGTISLPRSS